MAARRKLVHDQNTRDKIQVAQIINRLTDCINGKIELSPAQVNAAKILLNKKLPDLKQMEIDAKIGGDAFEQWLKSLK